jgi:hypothetical protein
MENTETIPNINNEVKTQTKNMFNFLKNSNIDFEGEKDDENVLIFTRRHWTVIVSPIVLGFFATLLPIIIILVGAPMILKYHLAPLFTLGWAIYIMVIWYYVFYKITIYSLDIWIVTNQRIVDMYQSAFFRRTVSELHLDAIQDISVNVDGAMESYFDFGNIEIQTAGALDKFLFEQVPHPMQIKDTIMEASAKFKIDNDIDKKV